MLQQMLPMSCLHGDSDSRGTPAGTGVGLLGGGGAAEEVMRADVRLGREIALKVLPETAARHAEHLARLEREARIVAGLNHPNIVTRLRRHQSALPIDGALRGRRARFEKPSNPIHGRHVLVLLLAEQGRDGEAVTMATEGPAFVALWPKQPRFVQMVAPSCTEPA